MLGSAHRHPVFCRNHKARVLPILGTIAAILSTTLMRSLAFSQLRRGALLRGLCATAPAGLLQPNPARALTTEERRVISLFQHASPSILGISPAEVHSGRSHPMTATAFVWDDKHIVTSFRALKSFLPRPEVTFVRQGSRSENDREVLNTEIVGADPSSDIAVLQLIGNVPDKLRPLPHGSSSSLRVGQEVYAIGHPFGLEHSMSHGVISGLSRTIEVDGGMPISGVIQTDASLNIGYSGGPLLDSSGAVVGVNTATLGNSRIMGVGLAVPIDAVKRNVVSVIENGYVSRPWLGVAFAPDLTAAGLGPGGAMVLKVVPGGPADSAGLRPMHSGLLGDIVVGLEGVPIASSADVFKALDQKAPGDSVLVSVLRPAISSDSDDYEHVELRIQLGALQQRLSPI